MEAKRGDESIRSGDWGTGAEAIYERQSSPPSQLPETEQRWTIHWDDLKKVWYPVGEPDPVPEHGLRIEVVPASLLSASMEREEEWRESSLLWVKRTQAAEAERDAALERERELEEKLRLIGEYAHRDNVPLVQHLQAIRGLLQDEAKRSPSPESSPPPSTGRQ